jgi:hypothetical protein
VAVGLEPRAPEGPNVSAGEDQVSFHAR